MKNKEKTPKIRKNHGFMKTMRDVFKTPSAKLGGILFALMVIGAVFAPLIAPYSPTQPDYMHVNSAPSALHIFGTDSLGRDIFSRLLYGARYSLTLGIIAAVFGNACGVAVGSIAGFLGGRADNFIMRLCDVWAAIPGTLLSILVSATLGPGFVNTVLALSVAGVPYGARMVRGMTLAERTKEYLEAAETINCPKYRIIFSHLLPNVISPTLVSTTMAIGGTIANAAGLSYLGLGIQPPTPEWGAMLSEGMSVFRSYPHMMIFPGLTIGICVLAINLMGDGVRDAMDPKLRD